jgi:DNA processing protein
MLAENAEQVVTMLRWNDEKKPPEHKKIQLELFATLSEEEKKLVDLLKANGQTSIDKLAIDVSLPVSRVSSCVLSLEFAGILRTLPGKMYELI